MLRRFLGLLLLTAVAGCATTGGNPMDPLEGFNRAMFGFNEGVDKAILKPVATGYKTVMPEFARTGVTNFFSNLGDIWIGVNNVLQGKVGAGASDFGRFAINTTVGILGLIDVASNVGLEKHNEDFGQTLGSWGVGNGAYLVLPVFGPSTLRDGFSRLLIDWHGDPLWYVRNVPTRNELIAVRLIDGRARLLDAGRLAEEAALDHYAYIRDAFLQRRRSQIYDGNPPPEAEPDQKLDPDQKPDPDKKPDLEKKPDPDKKSEFGPIEDPAARAGIELPGEQVAAQTGEPVSAAADLELTPAMQYSEAKIEAAAAMLEPAGVPGSVYEPRIPNNYDALLDAPTVRSDFAQSSLRP